MNKTLIVAAFAGIFIAGAATAQDQLPGTQKTKCYGIVKTKDECRHGGGDERTCSGTASNVKDPNAWTLEYPATCVKQGRSLMPPSEKLD